MEKRNVGGLTLHYDPAETEAAGIVEEACLRSVHVIGETWGLEAPSDCRVSVMTSWLRLLGVQDRPDWALCSRLGAAVWEAPSGRREAASSHPCRRQEHRGTHLRSRRGGGG